VLKTKYQRTLKTDAGSIPVISKTSTPNVVPVCPMKAYERVEVQLHLFLTTKLDGLNGKCYFPGHFTSGR
jgi:hypothetical protein